MYILETKNKRVFVITTDDFDEVDEYTVFINNNEVIFKIKTDEVLYFGENDKFKESV